MSAVPRRPRGQARKAMGLRVVPPAPSTAPVAAEDTAVRPGTIYKIPVYEIHPRTGMILLYEKDRQGIERVIAQVPDLNRPHRGMPRIVYDYIGQTVRGIEIREGEHGEDKCWADLIAGKALVVERGSWDRQTRDLKEIAAIHVLRPRFNHDHNLGNPDRIPLYDPATQRWVQRELRWARDRAAGRPRWVPPTDQPGHRAEVIDLAQVRAGLAGTEPRYPVDWVRAAAKIVWRGLRAVPGPLWRGPAGFLGVSLAAYLGTRLLLDLGWEAWAAIGFAVTAVASLVLAAIVDIDRRRRRRRRRRPSPRKRS